MKKIKFETYNDGILYSCENKELYDENNNAKGKELAIKGKFFFSNSSIREEDKYKLNEFSKSTLKVKIKRNDFVKTTDLIKINEKVYSINFIDKNKTSLFLFLTDYADELDRIIEIYEIIEISTLQDPKELLLKKVFANIKSNLKESTENDLVQTSKNIKFKVKFINELIDISSTTKLKIKFEDKFYDIKSILDIDEQHEILEIEGVRE